MPLTGVVGLVKHSIDITKMISVLLLAIGFLIGVVVAALWQREEEDKQYTENLKEKLRNALAEVRKMRDEIERS